MTKQTTFKTVLMKFVPNMAAFKFDDEVTQSVVISPEEAKYLLVEWNYHRQRNVRPSRVVTYRRQMEAGDWIYRTEMHVGVLPDGTCALLNGYHRLTALAQVENPDFRMQVRLIYKSAKNQQDLADYYSVIDIGGVRSSGDAIRAQGLAEEWGVSVELLRSVGSASALIMTDFTGGRSNSWHSAVGRSMPARIRFIREWESEIRQAHELLKPALSQVKKLILRQPVTAIMLLNLRYSPDLAEEFWSSVITGEGLYLGMPAMTLRNYLISNPMSSTHEHVYARYVANCWNGFFRKETMSRVQIKNTVDTIVIEGTPYSRGRRERERLQRLEEQRQRAAQARAVKKNRTLGEEEEIILPEE